MFRLSTFKNVLESFIAGGDDIIVHIMEIWTQFRGPVVAPLLRILMYVSLAMSIMLFVEKVYMSLVVGFKKLFGKKTEKRYKWESFKDDIELGNSAYPLVLVQIPMFNEREVCNLYSSLLCLCFHFFNFGFLMFLFLFVNRFTSCRSELHVGFHGRLIVL